MSEYIEREAARKVICDACGIYDDCLGEDRCGVMDGLDKIPAADVVEVDAVLAMLDSLLGNCPCNYVDEWLSEVCELQDECPDPKDKYGCWRQYIKHFQGRKMNGGVNDA